MNFRFNHNVNQIIYKFISSKPHQCWNTEYCQIVSHILLNKWEVSVSQGRIPVASYQWNIKNNTSDTRVMENGKRHMRHLSKNNEEKSNSKYLTIGSSRHKPRWSAWQQLENTHLKTSRAKLIWIIMKGNQKLGIVPQVNNLNIQGWHIWSMTWLTHFCSSFGATIDRHCVLI